MLTRLSSGNTTTVHRHAVYPTVGLSDAINPKSLMDPAVLFVSLVEVNVFKVYMKNRLLMFVATILNMFF